MTGAIGAIGAVSAQDAHGAPLLAIASPAYARMTASRKPCPDSGRAAHAREHGAVGQQALQARGSSVRLQLGEVRPPAPSRRASGVLVVLGAVACDQVFQPGAGDVADSVLVLRQNRFSKSLTALPTSRRTCPGAGGSTRSLRQRATTAAASRSRDNSTGHS